MAGATAKVLSDGVRNQSIYYFSRKIGAIRNDAIGVDNMEGVMQEVANLMAQGWDLFNTHVVSDDGKGIQIMHIFVKYA